MIDHSIVLISALNDKEILGQALIFLLAGYETISTLLSFFLYVMATERTIQEKVDKESSFTLRTRLHRKISFNFII